MKIKLIYLAIFLVINISLSAQVKFGKVSKQELQEKYYPQDSTAHAAILFKSRSSKFEYSDSEGFIVLTKIHERLKIYDKDGIDWAKKEIDARKSNHLKESVDIKAYTFNLVKGKIIKEKLKSKDIFKEELSEYWTEFKFTMPNAKVGSIIEWVYTINSPFSGYIPDAILQYKIPVKHIEAKISIPQYFTFKYRPNLYYPIPVKTSKTNRTLAFSYRTSDDDTGAKTSSNNAKVNLEETVYMVSQNNIPAIIKETLIDNINNYIAKIHFEHASTQYPNEKIKFYSNNWESVAKSIYKNFYFGKQLANTNFLKSDVTAQIASANTNQQKAVILFQYIKSQIKWNGLLGKYTDKGIKKAYKEHEGNDADINLCLVAMFREAGLKANPVLISTRSHGIPLFPTKDGYNYVVAAIELAKGIVLFDATEVYAAPNILPSRALNWQGRLVRTNGTSTTINLFSAKPAKGRINLYVKMDSEGVISGLKRSSYYSNYALNFRKSKNSLSQNDLLSKLEENNDDIDISDIKIANKKDIFKPVVESFKFKAKDLCDVINDKIYFSPMLFLAEDKNPFTLEKRLYPIDFGSAWEDNYIISIQIPDDYAVTNLPKNMAIGLPDNLGVFKFVISKKGPHKIQLVSVTKFNRAIVPALYYSQLKEFYKQLIEKQTEKVVLTKI